MKRYPVLVVGTVCFLGMIFEAPRLSAYEGPATRPAHAADTSMILLTPREMKWETGPASLPRGAKVAVLEGNPAQPGPFTLRVKLPRNYAIRPHTHPGIEHVTVIEGVIFMGHGETFDRDATTRLPAGSFIAIQPGHTHFAMTRGPATIQLHGIGPWAINYVNPADDPRKQ
jgi:quercetin dioxygenase-like cupin family protein